MTSIGHPMSPEAIARFRARKQQDYDNCRAALDRGDFRTLEIVGHRFRGSAESFGYPELGATGERLESAAQRASVPEIEACLAELAAWLALNG